MTSPQPWDELVALYDGDPEDRPTAAVEDMVLAWPPLIDLLIRSMGTLGGKRILDFGCGTGAFARRLSALGAKVVGVDPSSAMIEAARRTAGTELDLRAGSMDALAPGERFDAITAIMVLQYVQDLPGLLTKWARHLEPYGTVGLVVCNPGFVRDLLKAGKHFRDFDSQDLPRRGTYDPTGRNPLPVFVRYAEEYTFTLEEYGLHLAFEARPPFTPDFLERYPRDYPTRTPAHLVLGFRRQTS